MDLKLSGKTVLITGGSKGIGFACAMGFAGEGCAVHIASRSKESLEAAREKIRSRHNVPVEIHPADFSKGDTVRTVVNAVGHADILVNNAGAIPRGDIFGMTEPKWREAWELKVFGYVNATRAMLEKMYARKKGAVVNIIGLAGESYNYDYVAGTMGNAGLMAFTRTLGLKVRPHGVPRVAVRRLVAYRHKHDDEQKNASRGARQIAPVGTVAPTRKGRDAGNRQQHSQFEDDHYPSPQTVQMMNGLGRKLVAA